MIALVQLMNASIVLIVGFLFHIRDHKANVETTEVPIEIPEPIVDLPPDLFEPASLSDPAFAVDLHGRVLEARVDYFGRREADPNSADLKLLDFTPDLSKLYTEEFLPKS